MNISGLDICAITRKPRGIVLEFKNGTEMYLDEEAVYRINLTLETYDVMGPTLPPGGVIIDMMKHPHEDGN